MSATAHLKAVSQELIELLCTHPKLVEPFLCGLPPTLPPGLPAEFREHFLKSAHNPDRREWLKSDIAAICPQHAEEILVEADLPGLDLDKFWEELAPCITGDASQQSPLGRCILGGTPLGKNLGYGPARFLSQSEVLQTSVALEGVDADVFKLRAQGIRLPPKSADFLLTVFEALSQYYRQAADDQKGMLLSMA